MEEENLRYSINQNRKLLGLEDKGLSRKELKAIVGLCPELFTQKKTIAFGKPVFNDSWAAVNDPIERWLAGDPLDEVSHDFDLTEEQLYQAIQALGTFVESQGELIEY